MYSLVHLEPAHPTRSYLLHQDAFGVASQQFNDNYSHLSFGDYLSDEQPPNMVNEYVH
jgi:hypothetical protein